MFGHLDGAPVQAAAPVDFGVNFQVYGSEVFVQYRAWWPENFDTLKGLIFSFPGSRGDQRGIAGNGLWQFRLSQMGYGIVGFRDLLDFGYDYWGENDAEVQANFQGVLDSIAAASGHSELSNAPVLLDGVSKGGYSAGYLASFVPDRTLGFIADKGFATGVLDSTRPTAPGIVIAGERDDVVQPYFLNQDFLESRAVDGHTAYLVEWRTTHRETTEAFRLALMDQCMRARYPVGQLPSSEPDDPLMLNDPSGFLAETSIFDPALGQLFNPDPIITPEAVYPLDSSKASWLASETLALLYRIQNENTQLGSKVQFSPVAPFNGKVDLSVQITGIESTRLWLYHESELLGEFDPSQGPVKFSYVAKENGLQTFFAIAEYSDGGVLKTTGNYLPTVVAGAVVVPEPATAILLAVSSCTILLPRSNGRILPQTHVLEPQLVKARVPNRKASALSHQGRTGSLLSAV
ncbi:hypothetical protein [Bythopirellula goksoeyrii]|nr:hypothetical protein [Bythopirellula goksoeyrii]